MIISLVSIVNIVLCLACDGLTQGVDVGINQLFVAYLVAEVQGENKEASAYR